MTFAAALPAETVTLANGLRVSLRALRLDDQERLKTFVLRLSPQSIFQRVLEYRTMITDHEAELLCAVNGTTQVALAATHWVEGCEEILAVARYSLVDPDRPGLAEPAIVVEDAFQRCGLGRLMMARLIACARVHGVVQFAATVHPNNLQILRFIEKSGYSFTRHMVQGLWELTIQLTPAAPETAGP